METQTQQSNIAAIASKFINNTDRHVFLTGKAGTGKTTFLRHITQQTFKQSMIAAPTGIAAINAGGVTLHSLFQLPFGSFVPDNGMQNALLENSRINTPATLFKGYKMQSRKRRLLQELELLIIDEVSMLRADMLDAVDTVLRSVRRKRNIPFGGVQVLFIGDLLQLPPVVKNDEWRILKNYYDTPYFFDSLVLKNNPPVYLELDKIYRQSDPVFIQVLNNLRNNTVAEEDVEILNRHYKPNFKPADDEKYIHLTTHNHKADALNSNALRKLETKSHFFDATVEGDFKEYAYPVEPRLELKKGAQIMFVKNDPNVEKRFFNGKIGTVSSIIDEDIWVEFDDGSEGVYLEQYTWENIKYTLDEETNEIREEVIGKFIQYPVKLAWAITVHKSQGLTFDKAIIDIGQAFAPGQVYVALSRLTSLNGLVLSSPINYNSLEVDKNISAYAESKPDKEKVNNLFNESTRQYLKKYVVQAFDFSDLFYQVRNHVSSYSKDEKRSAKQNHLTWALGIQRELEEKKKVADKFLSQLKNIMAGDDYLPFLNERINAAKNHFEPVFEDFSDKMKKHIELLRGTTKVKTYINEIKELDALFYKQQQLIHKSSAMVQSAIDNNEFSVDNINTRQADEKRKEEAAKLDPPKPKKKKLPKGETQRISFEMYKSGKTIKEIAQERKLALTTIEGHLAKYAGLGMVPVTDFVTQDKLDQIIDVIKSIKSLSLGEIKNRLGDDFSYTDIKFAIAYAKNANLEFGDEKSN